MIEMDAETKRRVDAMWAQPRAFGCDRRHARRPDVCRRIAAGALRQFRQASAHALRASLRAARRGRRLARRARSARRSMALVVVAFSAARWAAMGFNRIADRAYRRAESAHHEPRAAARRALLARRPGRRSWWPRRCSSSPPRLLNPLCLCLSPIALGWVLTYSLSKRFTWWPHLWLGMSLAIAPVGGYLAVTGAWSEPVVAAAGGRRRGRDVGGGLRHLLRAAGRADSIATTASGARSCGSASRRAILLAKVLHGGDHPGARASSATALGSARGTMPGSPWPPVILAYEHRLVRPGDLSQARRRLLHDERRDVASPSSPSRSSTGSSDDGQAAATPWFSRSPARRVRRTRCACSRSWHANQVPVWLIPSSHGMRLLREECGIDSVEALRKATGEDWPSVTVFPDDDRGALPGLGLPAHNRWDGHLSLLDGHGGRDRRRHQPVAGGARGRRYPQGAAPADPAFRARRRCRWFICAIWSRSPRPARWSFPRRPASTTGPSRVAELVDFIVQRILDHLDIDIHDRAPLGRRQRLSPACATRRHLRYPRPAETRGV